MPVAGGPKITTTGILLEVDAANASSYTSGSSTWVNVFRPGTRNGTINGTIGFSPTDNYGALTYPGITSSYVDFGNIGDLSVSWSFQVAVKPAPSSSGNYTILSYASGSNTGSWTYKLDYSSSNQSAVLSVYSATGSTQVVYRVTGSVPTGSWSIVNASYGNSVIGMYVNGRPTDYVVTTGSVVGYNANNRLYLGGTFGVTSSYYTGSMASFFSYNTDVPNTQLIQNYNAYATRFGLPPSVLFPSSVDPDAFRFIEVAQITDQTQINSINSLVLGLKANSLWDKMVAIYPFIGGTAFSHKWNLKNPSDSSSAYRIIFSGAVIHSSKGVAFDGNSLASTNLAPFTALSNPTQSNHISVYISGSAPGSLTSMGNTNFVENGMGIGMGSQSRMNAYTGTGTAINITTNDGPTGLAIATRTDSTNSAAYIRGSVTRTSTSTLAPPTSPRTGIIFIGKENGAWSGTGTGTFYSFSSIGTGLTTADVENLYAVVQTYNTSLNRAFNQ
jgi:hypothetical protein